MSKSMKFLKALCAYSMLIGIQNGASASAHETASLQVTATLQNSCTIAATPLAFGNITNPTVDTSGTATLTYNCTNGMTGYIGLNQGSGGTAVNARQLTNNASSSVKLNYWLYQDSSRAQNWGNTPGSTGDAKAFTGTGASANMTVYGFIPAGQTPAQSGMFGDTVTVTVYY